MNYKSKALLAAIAVLACSALLGVGPASATVLCKSSPSTHACPTSDLYGKGTSLSSHVKSGTSIIFTIGAGETYISCSEGTVSGTISNPGSTTTSTEFSEVAYKFSSCNRSMATVKKGLGAVTWTTGTHNGSVAQANNEISWNIGGVNCYYTIGTSGFSPMEIQGGASATLQYSKTAVVKTAGSFVCPNEMKMTATFSVETPAPLYVEQGVPASVLCKSAPASHVCPAGDVYGVGTSISANLVPKTSFVLSSTSNEVLASCTAGGFSGTVSAAGSESTSARLEKTEHTYSGCTTTVTGVSTGEMELNWVTGTDNGVATQTGGESQWTLFGVKCTYSITGGEIIGGAAPKLLYHETTVAKTAGGFLCPAQLKATAEYNIESPTPLYVEL